MCDDAELSFQYDYFPLLDPSTYIRLLVFVAPTFGPDIHCRLVLHELRVGHTIPLHMSYNAISYTWGPPQPTRVIFVDGRPIVVRENCWYALWQARKYLTTLSGADTHRIWIDSLCINQRDATEKSVQVAMMHRIYSAAVQTLVCIGQHADGSELFFHRASAGSDPDDDSGPFFSIISRNYDYRSALWALVFGSCDYEQTRSCIQALAQRPYFRRLWIVQELHESRAAVLCCGEHTANLATLFQLAWHMTELPGPWGSPEKREQISESLNFIFKVAKAREGKTTLVKLLQIYAGFECSDIRDKIYALLNIQNLPKHDGSLVPDYTCTLPDLLFKTAARTTSGRYSESLDVLLDALSLRIGSIELRPFLEDRVTGREPLTQTNGHPGEGLRWQETVGDICLLTESNGQLHAHGLRVDYSWVHAHPSSPAAIAPDVADRVSQQSSDPPPQARSILARVRYAGGNMASRPRNEDEPRPTFLTSLEVSAGDILVILKRRWKGRNWPKLLIARQTGTCCVFTHHVFFVGKPDDDGRAPNAATLRFDVSSHRDRPTATFTAGDYVMFACAQKSVDSAEDIRRSLSLRVSRNNGACFMELSAEQRQWLVERYNPTSSSTWSESRKFAFGNKLS